MPTLANLLVHCHGPYRHQQGASQEAVPRVVTIVRIAMVHENWPLVAGNSHLAISKFLLDSVNTGECNACKYGKLGSLVVRPV